MERYFLCVDNRRQCGGCHIVDSLADVAPVETAGDLSIDDVGVDAYRLCSIVVDERIDDNVVDVHTIVVGIGEIDVVQHDIAHSLIDIVSR